eukprot:1152901-Pelagomonas_calceolata.AAC.9
MSPCYVPHTSIQISHNPHPTTHDYYLQSKSTFPLLFFCTSPASPVPAGHAHARAAACPEKPALLRCDCRVAAVLAEWNELAERKRWVGISSCQTHESPVAHTGWRGSKEGLGQPGWHGAPDRGLRCLGWRAEQSRTPEWISTEMQSMEARELRWSLM